MESEKIQRFKKLGTGGDFAGGNIQKQTYFESKGCWNFISEATPLVIAEQAELSAEMIRALCKFRKL